MLNRSKLGVGREGHLPQGDRNLSEDCNVLLLPVMEVKGQVARNGADDTQPDNRDGKRGGRGNSTDSMDQLARNGADDPIDTDEDIGDDHEFLHIRTTAATHNSLFYPLICGVAVYTKWEGIAKVSAIVEKNVGSPLFGIESLYGAITASLLVSGCIIFIVKVLVDSNFRGRRLRKLLK